jgi:hypothetical protein
VYKSRLPTEETGKTGVQVGYRPSLEGWHREILESSSGQGTMCGNLRVAR